MKNSHISLDLPSNFFECFGAIKREIAFLNHMQIYLHKALLDTFESRKRSVHQKIAPIFFSYTTHLFYDHLALSIAKLLDPSEAYKKPNASLFQLIDTIPKEHTSIISYLTTSLTAIKEKAAHITNHRNKRISHNDYSVYALNSPLPAISEDELMKTLRSFEDFLNYIEVNLLRGTPVDYSAAEIREEAQRLFAFLKRYADSPI
jgi:hypothetical protein